MKFNAHLTAAKNADAAERVLTAVGADEGGVVAMTPKLRHYALKLEAVPAAAARAIKKALLELGAEAAISMPAYHGQAEATDAIMMATVEQYAVLARRLAGREQGLAELAADLPKLLECIERTRFTVTTPRGKLDLSGRPLLMGIINCTPDSFYDGGKYLGADAAVTRGIELWREGADLLDVGGESTRPGAARVSAEEEAARVVPVIERLAKETGALISVDTQKAEVARAAMAAGAAMINDISALADPAMAKTAAQTGAGLVLMHMQGAPETMQVNPWYNDLFGEVIAYLRERMARAAAAGVEEDRIIVDPGIGFGKTAAHNLELIRDLWKLRSLGRPLLLGPSNKSFIGKVLGVEPDDRMEGTAASVVAGVLAGAHILRLHEAAGMKRFMEMAWAIRQGEEWNKA